MQKITHSDISAAIGTGAWITIGVHMETREREIFRLGTYADTVCSNPTEEGYAICHLRLDSEDCLLAAYDDLIFGIENDLGLDGEEDEYEIDMERIALDRAYASF